MPQGVDLGRVTLGFQRVQDERPRSIEIATPVLVVNRQRAPGFLGERLPGAGVEHVVPGFGGGPVAPLSAAMHGQMMEGLRTNRAIN